MLFNLSEHNSIANKYLLELRDENIQKERMRFRRNLERLGEIMAYEISKTLSYEAVDVRTSLGISRLSVFHESPVLLCILRAGIPFLQGFQNYFDQSDAGFIGAYRNESTAGITINMEYAAIPILNDKTLILIDPMLATGKSLIATLRNLLSRHRPRKINIAAVIAVPEGIQSVSDFLAAEAVSFNIWTAAVDEKLDHNFYIVPGLGDAGDLSYGPKNG